MERRKKTETGHDGVRWLRTFGLFVLPAAAILSLGGCSKEPVDAPGDASGKVPLDFSVEGIGEMLPATKAALTSNTTVRVIAYNSNASNPAQANYVADQAYYWDGSKLVPCTVDDNGNKTADAANQVMKLVPDNYDFYAVSPALPLATDKRTLSTTVNNSVDYATTTSKKTQQIPAQNTPYALTLNELQRQCAQVKLIVTKDITFMNPTAISINSVKVTGLAAAVSGVTVGSDIAPASSGTQSLSLAGSDFTVSGTTFTQKTPSIVLPLNKATITIECGLTLDGAQKTVAGSVDVTLSKSNIYTITASIASESDIILSVEADWTQNSETNPEFAGRTYPYRKGDWTVVVKDAYGAANNCKLHAPGISFYEDATTANAWDRNWCFTSAQEFNLKYMETRLQKFTWAEARSACGDGWRLPTIAELNYAMIVCGFKSDHTGGSDVPFILGTCYWTCVSRESDTSYAYGLYGETDPEWTAIWTGKIFAKYLDKTEKRYVRCVKDVR